MITKWLDKVIHWYTSGIVARKMELLRGEKNASCERRTNLARDWL